MRPRFMKLTTALGNKVLVRVDLVRAVQQKGEHTLIIAEGLAELYVQETLSQVETQLDNLARTDYNF